MLTVLAFGMVIVFMTLILTKRVSALIALIVVPVATAVVGGFGKQIGPMMLDGIKELAPTGVMLMFAILYFGIMIDAGLFDPVVRRILEAVKGDPLRIVVGTAILALVVSLDGDGSTTYMVTTAALLPLYVRVGINPLILTCVVMLASGVCNITPWGGPTARAASALGVDPSAIFVPMIPAMLAGALWTIFVAFLLGRRERKRVGIVRIDALEPLPDALTDEGEDQPHHLIRRPGLLTVNAFLTLALMVLLVLGTLPLPVLFMFAFAMAMLINYPSVEEQKERLAAHSGNVLAVVSLIFAAGVFTGILSGTEMVDAMANSVIKVIPPDAAPYLPVVTAIASVPFTFFISNDAFYFGVLPILSQAASLYGIDPAAMGRASIIGQPVHLLSPLVPSTYLLVGLAKVDFADHQRYTLKWAIGAAMVLMLIGLASGVIPVMGTLVATAP
jgi:citrate-Mg2+:H+ or citrate-Ca2+:H+ symporter, CitMHS family